MSLNCSHKTPTWRQVCCQKAGDKVWSFYLIDTAETNTAEQQGVSVQMNTNMKKYHNLVVAMPSKCFTGDNQVRLETALFTQFLKNTCIVFLGTKDCCCCCVCVCVCLYIASSSKIDETQKNTCRNCSYLVTITKSPLTAYSSAVDVLVMAKIYITD